MEEQTIRIFAAVALIVGALIVVIVLNIQVTRQQKRQWRNFFQVLTMINANLSDLSKNSEELNKRFFELFDEIIVPKRVAKKLEIKASESMRGDSK